MYEGGIYITFVHNIHQYKLVGGGRTIYRQIHVYLLLYNNNIIIIIITSRKKQNNTVEVKHLNSSEQPVILTTI